MRLGSDALKLPDSADHTPVEQLERAHAEGLAGLFFRHLLHVSGTLDRAELGAVRQRADELGMYLEAGLGRVNPYNIPESPEMRILGDGDTVLGYRRVLEAAAGIGITELWAETATFKPFRGRFAYDRYRTDAPWADQLAATVKFLHTLAPIARDLGIHINLETHEEITSFELVRIVEAVGPDVLGITFDTGNVVQRLEHPTWAARRLAPYVRQTHIKDYDLVRVPDGLDGQLRPNGDGVVDLTEIVPILYAANPDLHLSLEVRAYGDGAGEYRTDGARIALYDPVWLAGHPDLTTEELVAYLEMLQRYEERVAAGAVDSFATYRAAVWDEDAAWRYVRTSRDHVRGCAEKAGIVLDGTRVEADA
ncbi:sugar phosphate isomerase/epimerase family protein [Nocardia jiangxiensis]|uniref:Sugar phosphate isomerase/epimerase family protein n=1 Tax=Nocardia jiangxiensis TaxID=282685 RepID=A0ABW6RUG9_9NOCA|nr:sugar phosphate isomerase/epimerase family protein [Nocardia jiangxiensis]